MRLFSTLIEEGLDPGDSQPLSPQHLPTLSGSGSSPSCFSVSAFSQASIAVAVAEVQRLRQQVWGKLGESRVDRLLASAWAQHSVRPIGWTLPNTWDAFAGDYQSIDGWIRLHTNATHHRTAALRVLGNPKTGEEARDAVAAWKGLSLESAVVAEGGAAAYMMNRDEWNAHEQGHAVASEAVVAWRTGKAARPERNAMAIASANRPLQGVRVLDLTRVIAGPVCTRFLASLGADVLRVDPLDWDEGANVLELTLGKRCTGLNLHDTHDRLVFESLLRESDLFVHGYRGDALEQLGFGKTRREALNPSLLEVSLNAYGWTGPWRYRRGFDSLVQMSSGIAQQGQKLTKANKPIPLPYQALDHSTGYLMAAAAIRALTDYTVHGRPMAARLSLARQAKLLQDSFSLPTESDAIMQNSLPELGDQHLQNGEEHTDWGPLKRLILPYQIDGVTLGFNSSVCQLRSSKPSW